MAHLRAGYGLVEHGGQQRGLQHVNLIVFPVNDLADPMTEHPGGLPAIARALLYAPWIGRAVNLRGVAAPVGEAWPDEVVTRQTLGFPACQPGAEALCPFALGGQQKAGMNAHL